MEVTLDGETLSDEEIARCSPAPTAWRCCAANGSRSIASGSTARCSSFREVRGAGRREGLTFGEAMRLLAGAAIAGDDAPIPQQPTGRVCRPGPWLAETLKALRVAGWRRRRSGPGLQGTLRPYQQAGVHWLHLLSRLGLGACLADDMGLGKTIQVLSLLLVQRRKSGARTAAQPARGAGVAARQLGGGDRALRARA